MPMRLYLSLVLVSFASAAFLIAQEDEDELAPGLIAEYHSGDHLARRIDGDLAFDWSTGSPDWRLPAGSFAAHWTGQILLRTEGKYRWHAHLQGDVTIRVNDQIVFSTKSETPQWVSGEEINLSFGEFPLEISYRSPGGGRLFLCWSSDSFPLEPLPHHVLFHERTDLPRGPLLPAIAAMFNSRCDRCHGEVAGLSSSPAPSLTHVGVETSAEWIVQRIQLGGGEHGQMPSFGFSRSEAEAILAALQVRVQPLELPTATLQDQPDAKDIDAGRELLISTGCLACHEWQTRGRAGEFGGPRLDDVAKHRTAKWLEQWLIDPAKLHPQHRMPVFTLTNDERRQIVSALIAPHQSLAVSPPHKNVSRETLDLGNKLITEARCASCHELPGSTPDRPAAPFWRELNLDGDGCWSGNPTGKQRRPVFAQLDAGLLRGFLRGVVHQTMEPSADLRGAALLIQKGCVNCHDRDGRKGISALAADLAKSTPRLEGRTMYLIPPSLTAVGDRLPDERLAQAIRGDLPSRRLDWLLVRMPKYRHTEAEQSALMSHLLGHDRIPDHAPASPDYPLSPGTEATLAGRELLGSKGFSCVACHPVKDFTPKNVALGTRGSNLFRIDERLRPEYFFRWTRSPLRVMPGVEMPGYQRPHATIFPGDMNRQLAAIWTALNDPNLPTPVNPGAVEQYWTVGRNDPPRILRDVVTLPGKKKETVPRAFAVGFPNGHNVLFDLDTASLRAWTVGDFAQQRTQGKSWFWDLVGTPLLVNESGESDLMIYSADGKTILFPSKSASIRLINAEIDRYKFVRFSYAIQVETEGRKIELTILESWGDAKKALNRWFIIDSSEESRRLQLFLLEPNTLKVRAPGEVKVESNHAPISLPQIERPAHRIDSKNSLIVIYSYPKTQQLSAPPVQPATFALTDNVTAVPGFRGERLPFPTSIMPTAITFDHRGKLLFASLKGHVYRGDDQSVSVFAEGLAAPFGILESLGMVVVAHKPEIVGLTDADEDGKADAARVIATGWGLSDDYHDWTCGLVRDAEGNLFTTLGSDYADKNRPEGRSRWRGHAIKIDPAGQIESLARGLRFPTGVAMTSREDVFITDQQGIQNPFNELNWLDHKRPGPRTDFRFGVPSLREPDKEAPSLPPAVQIPHPWTRSVNGICAIPQSLADRTHAKLYDQILGCEYDNKALIRMSWQLVDGVMQGAAYPLSKSPSKPGAQNPGSSSNRDSLSRSAESESRLVKARTGIQEDFLGPMSIAVSPGGDLYVGSIHDSGWQGGLNTGDIVKLSPEGRWPNGLCEIRVTAEGFELEFFHPLEKSRAEDKSKYQISGYTRVWQGSYASPDSGRHAVEVSSAKLSDNGTTVSLALSGLKPGHVYDVSVGDVGREADGPLWPNVGFYTLHRLPR